MRKTTTIALVLALAAFASGRASALDILLTNDDGFFNPGITTLRAALCGAGHHVTMVAPATNQSGRGGSVNTGALSSSSAMSLTKLGSDACGDTYSLAAPVAPGTYGGTPVDSMKTGLDVVLVGDPPDLIVSGNNFGQNLGMPTSNASGTVGAALQGAFDGIPAIAGSVGILISESPGFASTIASFPPAADFMVRLIAALEAKSQGGLLPRGVELLNVNFPVPYASIGGVAITRLASRSELELPLFDRNVGFPSFGIPGNPGVLNCGSLAVGESCSVGVGIQFVTGPDAVRAADTDAYAAGLISITPMDGNMTSGGAGNALHGILSGLAP
jgi:5'-nucleotidase